MYSTQNRVWDSGYSIPVEVIQWNPALRPPFMRPPRRLPILTAFKPLAQKSLLLSVYERVFYLYGPWNGWPRPQDRCLLTEVNQKALWATVSCDAFNHYAMRFYARPLMLVKKDRIRVESAFSFLSIHATNESMPLYRPKCLWSVLSLRKLKITFSQTR